MPTKVFVQGFYNFKEKKGALRNAERDEWATKLMSHVPTDLKGKFEVEKRYNLTQRLTFVSKEGGELCCELREKLVDAIEANKYKINGDDLKCALMKRRSGEQRGTSSGRPSRL